MTRIPDNGDAFEGIDPHLLAQLMTSLRSGVSGAQQLASSYLGQFGGFGLDTSRISRLLQDYGWAQGQQPMLQRRYDLASNQPSGQWVNGLATSGASYLEFSTQAQAQAAGAKAAKQLKDGNITYAQFYAELLQEYKNDPDWATGAIKTLGPDYVGNLEQETAN